MPSGPEIRPTLDMVRKALFDIIGSDVRGCRFLDLFAGTGANGIEALSRGAIHAVFVDSSRFCIEAIRSNLEKTHLAEKGKIIKCDVFKFLQNARPENGIFDIVFADPPYRTERIRNIDKHEILNANINPVKKCGQSKKTGDSIPPAERALHHLSSGTILGSDALVIIEHSPKTKLPERDSLLTLLKSRRYGSTTISIYKRA